MSDASDLIQEWIRRAYREPDDPAQINAPRFTRWNMEVAFRAGIDAASRAHQKETPCGQKPNWNN